MRPPFGVVEEMLLSGRGHYFTETGEMYSTAGLFPPLAPNEIELEKAVNFINMLCERIDERKAAKYVWTFVVAGETPVDAVLVRIEIDPINLPTVTLIGNDFQDCFVATVNTVAVILKGLAK